MPRPDFVVGFIGFELLTDVFEDGAGAGAGGEENVPKPPCERGWFGVGGGGAKAVNGVPATGEAPGAAPSNRCPGASGELPGKPAKSDV